MGYRVEMEECFINRRLAASYLNMLMEVCTEDCVTNRGQATPCAGGRTFPRVSRKKSNPRVEVVTKRGRATSFLKMLMGVCTKECVTNRGHATSCAGGITLPGVLRKKWNKMKKSTSAEETEKKAKKEKWNKVKKSTTAEETEKKETKPMSAEKAAFRNDQHNTKTRMGPMLSSDENTKVTDHMNEDLDEGWFSPTTLEALARSNMACIALRRQALKLWT